MSWNKAFLVMNSCWYVHEVMFLSPSSQNKRDEHLLKRRNVPNECFCEDSDADGDFRSVRSYTSPLKLSWGLQQKSDQTPPPAIFFLSFSLLLLYAVVGQWWSSILPADEYSMQLWCKSVDEKPFEPHSVVLIQSEPHILGQEWYPN